MTDWTLIAGGRCSGTPWRIGIAGYSLECQQVFVLSDANWASVKWQMPLEPLGAYGKPHDLLFERMTNAASAPSYDGLLLIALDWQGQPAFPPAAHKRHYLQLREASQCATLGNADCFTKVFAPMELPNFGEKWNYLDSWVMADPGYPPAEWGVAREPHDKDHSRLFHRSADFWIHRITAAIAADVAALRGIAPQISVVIPTYNHGRFLRQCVQSVLDQGIDDIEVLVLDNASTDETPQVMAAFAHEPRVRYMRNRYNYGPGYNWENGLWIALGRYFTFLSADDYFNPGHLARLLPVLQAHPEVAVGYTSIRWVNEEGAALAQPRHPGYRPTNYVGGRNEVADLLIHDNYMAPSAVIYRREAFCQTWRPVKNNGGGDWDMAIQMAERFPDFAYVDTPGVSYRWHGAQHSQQSFYTSTAPLEDHLSIVEGVFARGAQHHLKGQEHEVAAHIQRRLALYPAEFSTPLGGRAKALVQRLRELAQWHEAPLFSVILTTYNRPHLLRDALDSLAQQTMHDFEVILVNDHGEPVEHLLDGYGFALTYLRQGKNQGLSAARNAGLKVAQGRYAAYLDDDDLYRPHHLATLAAAFVEHPHSVVYTDAEYVSETLEEDQRIVHQRRRRHLDVAFDLDRLFVANYIPVNTWAHPRSALTTVGEFDTELTAFEDWDMLLRLALRHDFVHVPLLTAEVRSRGQAGGSDHMLAREKGRFLTLYREIYRRYPVPDNPAIAESRRAQLHQMATQDTSVAQWLAQRVPTAMQSHLMAERLARGVPALAVFIRVRGAPEHALAATLSSLAALQPPFAPQSVTVLGAQAVHSALPQLQCLTDTATPTAQIDAIRQQVQAMACDWLMMVDAGECFTPSGLPIVALNLRDAQQCRAVYADALVQTDTGEPAALMRPDFNLDMLLSCPANMARHWLFRSDVFLEAGGFDAAYAQAPEFELLLRLIETGGLDGLAHVHEPLLTTAAPPLVNNEHELAAIAKHLRARGYDNATVNAALPGRYRIIYGHTAQPLVSIIIPTKDLFALLERCVSSLLEKTAYPHYEILLVDNGSTDPAACAWLDGLEALGEARLRVLRYPEPFNYAAMNNLAAHEARGDYLVLLNNDTAIAQSDWLDTLLNHAQRPEVGVVGAKLLYPNGQVQHAGLLLGLHGMAGYPFSGAAADAPGYMQRLVIDQNYSAVSAACLMVRRTLYNELGGMDADAFPLICGDMDLCLRARAAGYLTVWTPHAVLLHEKGATLTSTPPEAFGQQRERAQDEMYRRWLHALAHDPAYNRNLSLQSTEFAVETDTRLNWNPLPWRPLPVVLAVHADNFGCGHYRIIHPGQGMTQAGLADVRVSEYHYGPVEMERLQPDAWVLQRLVLDAPFEMVRRTAPFTNAFKVAELDDYLLNLPLKNGHRDHMPKEVPRLLRRWLALMDRFVVSTGPLAEAMAGLHPDIRVVPNRLLPDRWGRLVSLRRQGRRPRVGWAGGAGHQGDLELIADVVKALADEVEWVFLGMCPQPMRRYLHEYHVPVTIEAYPAKLASLNLDLALAPLEHNIFNDCKSNLRLLEYGACGYPVVCSDVTPYQGDLPVTRVKNRYKDWVDAIRMHLADLDATAAAGDALRDAVRQNWMLEGAHLDDWLRAWLPG